MSDRRMWLQMLAGHPLSVLLSLTLVACIGVPPDKQAPQRDATEKAAEHEVAKRDEAATGLTVTVEIVCAAHGARIPRAVPVGEVDSPGVDVVNRSVFWLINKARYNDVDAVAKVLADLRASGPQLVEVIAGPGTLWTDIVQLYELLAMRNFPGIRLPGDWRVHPYAMDLQPRPPSSDGRLVAPVIVTPWLPESNEHLAELQVDQVGRVRLNGMVLLDPPSGRDRSRVRKAIADLGMRARERQETEEIQIGGVSVVVATSRLLIYADRWTDWQHVYGLMKDLTDADPPFPSFDVAVQSPKADAVGEGK